MSNRSLKFEFDFEMDWWERGKKRLFEVVNDRLTFGIQTCV